MENNQLIPEDVIESTRAAVKIYTHTVGLCAGIINKSLGYEKYNAQKLIKIFYDDFFYTSFYFMGRDKKITDTEVKMFNDIFGKSIGQTMIEHDDKFYKKLKKEVDEMIENAAPDGFLIVCRAIKEECRDNPKSVNTLIGQALYTFMLIGTCIAGADNTVTKKESKSIESYINRLCEVATVKSGYKISKDTLTNFIADAMTSAEENE